MKKLISTALLAASALGATQAQAVSFLDLTTGKVQLDANANNSSNPFNFTIYYNGYVGSPSNVLSGLTAKIDFSFLGSSVVDGKTNYNFSYTLTNTSKLPFTSSRVSIFGFDSDPNVVDAKATGVFDTAAVYKFGKKDGPDAGFNTPNAGPTVEVCIKGGNDNNCTGGGSYGVTMSPNVGTGTMSLIYKSAPLNALVTLSDFYIRYQDVASNDSASNVGSASGGFTQPPPNVPDAVVPEPATWAMMIGGFGLLGAAVRRRRAVGVTYA